MFVTVDTCAAHVGQRQVTLQTVAMAKARKTPSKKRKISLELTIGEYNQQALAASQSAA